MDGAASVFKPAEIDFVLGDRYLLTVHDGTLGASKTAPLRFGVEKALEKGPDFLLYALTDAVVDGYFLFVAWGVP